MKEENTSFHEVTHSSLPDVLKKVHVYMGALWVYRTTNSIVASDLERDVSGLKKEINTSRLSLRVTIGSTTFQFNVIHHSRVDLTVSSSSGGPQQTFDSMLSSSSPSPSSSLGLENGITSLSPNETEAISTFWKTKVATPPYRIQPLSSFIRILSLPLPALKEFIEIMSMDNNTSQKPGHVTLCMIHKSAGRIKEAIVHSSLTSEISFVLHIKSPNGILEISLRYQYISHTLKLVEEGTQQHRQYCTDLLDRGIARARSAEAGNTFLPSVVKALAVVVMVPPISSLSNGFQLSPGK